jgi:hypothetical protein
VSLDGKFDWRWTRQSDPAPARAVVAWGGGAPHLHARLQSLLPEHQARLLATAGADVLIVSGETLDLPWIDGAAYAAPCAEAPGLWLPTLWRPDLPCDLLWKALHKRHARQPLLLWPTPPAIVPLDRQLPLSAAHLARIQSLWQAHGVQP